MFQTQGGDSAPQDIKIRNLLTLFIKYIPASVLQGLGRQRRLGAICCDKAKAVISLYEECCLMLFNTPKRHRKSTALALGSWSKSLKTEK